MFWHLLKKAKNKKTTCISASAVEKTHIGWRVVLKNVCVYLIYIPSHRYVTVPVSEVIDIKWRYLWTRSSDFSFFADAKKPDKIFSRCRCGEKALFCPPVALLLSDGQKDGTWHYWVKRGPAKSDITWIRLGSRPGYNGTGIVFLWKRLQPRPVRSVCMLHLTKPIHGVRHFHRFTGWIKSFWLKSESEEKYLELNYVST